MSEACRKLISERWLSAAAPAALKTVPEEPIAVTPRPERFLKAETIPWPGAGLSRPCGYFWSAALSYRPAAEQQRLVELLRAARAAPSDILAMERSAKARGHVEFGRGLHELFVERLVASGESHRFRALPFLDTAGDPIYLSLGSPSLRSWELAERSLSEIAELRGFAQALARFVSVELPETTPAESLRRICRETARYAQNGLPLPPHFRVYGDAAWNRDAFPSGTYSSERDTLSLRWDWDESNLAHEWGHFWMDLMDDRDGPNGSFAQAPFHSARCRTLESVSEYGGACDRDRRAGRARVRDGQKAKEEPAEVLGFVLDERRGVFWRSTAAMNLLRFHYESKGQVLAEVLQEIPAAKLSLEEIRYFSAAARDYHRFLGSDVPAPPAWTSQPKSLYLRQLVDWQQKVRDEAEKAKAIREEKLAWGRSLLDALHPSNNWEAGKPGPILPWVLGIKIFSGHPSTSGQVPDDKSIIQREAGVD